MHNNGNCRQPNPRIHVFLLICTFSSTELNLKCAIIAQCSSASGQPIRIQLMDIKCTMCNCPLLFHNGNYALNILTIGHITFCSCFQPKNRKHLNSKYNDTKYKTKSSRMHAIYFKKMYGEVEDNGTKPSQQKMMVR